MDAGMLEETKSVLKSLIISSPHGMTIDRLNRDYKEWEGRGIPYSDLGYNKLETFLRSLSDTLVVTGSGFNATVTAIASEKSAHIDKMVTKQKSSTRKRSRLKTDQREMQSNENCLQQGHTFDPKQIWQKPIQQSFNSIQSTEALIKQQHILHNVFRQQQQVQQTLQQNLMQNCYRLPTPTATYGYNNFLHHPLLSSRPQYRFDSWQNFQYSLQTSPQYMAYNQHQSIPLLNKLNQMDIKYNSSQNQKSQENHQTNGVANQEDKKEISSQSFQYNSTTQSNEDSAFKQDENTNESKLCSSLNDQTEICNLEPRVPNGNHVSDKTSSSLSTSTPPTDCDKQKYSILQSTSSRTYESNSNGDPLGEISKEQLLELEEKFSEMNLSPKSVKEEKKPQKENNEAVPELQKNDIVFQLDYPVDTVKYGEKIPESVLPPDLLDADWFGVFIAEVHNPFKFWFHIHKENHELDILMQHIENSYTKIPPTDLQLHRSCYKPGQVCCALYMGLWHRGQILEVPENNTVKVFFVDYGTVSSVALQEVKYLLSEFSSLPCQALRGCLAHIKPVQHRWSRDATYAFLSLVQNLFLYAKATEIDYKEKVVTMVLTDTNNKADFQINEALIRKGYARISLSAQPSSSETLQVNDVDFLRAENEPRKKHYQEFYPTFDMLEKGEYPSFYEISLLLTKGIDFEALQDENIIPTLDGGYSIDEITKKLTDPKANLVEKCSDTSEFTVNRHKNPGHPKYVNITKSSDNENSSLSSISDNLNPFLSDLNGESELQRNSVQKLNSTSASNYDPSIDHPNPFLSDSDSEKDFNCQQQGDNMKSRLHHHSTQSELLQKAQEIITQTQQQIFYGFLPSSNSRPNQTYFTQATNLPYNGVIQNQVTTTTLIRPPPGFEHFKPKARNAFQ